MPRSTSRLDSFRHALRGFVIVLRTQRNAWIHAGLSLAVLALGIWLNVGRTDWALLLLAIGLVWLAEFVNTSLEAVVDLASPAAHPLARAGKDIGAAAVVIAALTAAGVGALVLGPPLWLRLGLDRLLGGGP